MGLSLFRTASASKLPTGASSISSQDEFRDALELTCPNNVHVFAPEDLLNTPGVIHNIIEFLLRADTDIINYGLNSITGNIRITEASLGLERVEHFFTWKLAADGMHSILKIQTEPDEIVEELMKALTRVA